jgi:hypothetical protein
VSSRRSFSLSTEETRVVISNAALESFTKADKTKQLDLISELADVASSTVPPDKLAYETIGNITIYRAGGKPRWYTAVVTNIPRGNTHYHIIHALYTDPNHEYDETDLVEVDGKAEREIARIQSLATVEDVESYLQEHDALTAEDLDDLLD